MKVGNGILVIDPSRQLYIISRYYSTNKNIVKEGIEEMEEYKVAASGSEARHIIELLKAEAEGRMVVSPVKIGDKVKVDARTLPHNYLHPLDGCNNFATCMVIGFVKTKSRAYMKLVALYPSRMNSRGYLKYSMSAVGKTVFISQ